jgi:hypothetical protein
MGTVDFGAFWVLLAMVLVPGVVASMAVYGPGTIPLPTRLAVVFALGYVVPGFVAYVLALLHILEPIVFFLVLGATTAALVVRARRLGGVRAHGHALVQEIRSEPWTAGVGLAVFVAILVLRVFYLPGAYTLRYWVDATEIADAGHIPHDTLMYGTFYPTVTSKVFLNVFNAGAVFAAGRGPFGPLGALLWIASVGLAASMWAVGRELGLRNLAPALPLLLVTNKTILATEITRDLGGYKAETFGRMLAFCALAIGVRAFRDRRRTDLLVTAVLLGVTMATHLVPFVVVVSMLGAYWVARVILDMDRRLVLSLGAASVIAGVALGGIILILPRGDIGLEGARGSQATTPAAGFDETYFLYTGNFRPLHDDASGPWYIRPKGVVEAFMAKGIHLGRGSPFHRSRIPIAIGLGIASLLLAAVMLRWFPEDLRPIGLVAVGLAGALLLVTLFFSYRYNLWVEGTFGVRRLFEYGSIPLVLLALAVLEVGVRALGRIRPMATVAAGAAIVVLVGAILIPRSHPGPKRAATAKRNVAIADIIHRLVPCQARILADVRTVGFFRAMTGRVGVLEGMGPYLRPPMLHDVDRLLLSARAFFADPATHADFLVDQGIDYVVLIKGIDVGYRAPVAAGSGEGLAELPFLRVITTGEGVQIYQVVGLARGTGFVDPIGVPGYRCDPLG